MIPLSNGLRALASAPDVQGALGSAAPAANALIAAHGGDVARALAGTGVNLQGALSAAGAPPGIASIVAKGGAILTAKGSEGKLGGAADLVQGLINQSQGIAGQIGTMGTGLLTNAVGLRMHAAGKIGGAAGSGVGTAVFGPIGGAIGQAVGSFVGEGIRAVGKALGLQGAKAHRASDEKNREKDDHRRLADFLKIHPEAQSLPGLLGLFQTARIFLTSGVPGTKKWNESQHIAVLNGVLRTDITPGEMDQRPKDALMLSSNAVSAWMLNRLVQAEQEDAQRHVSALKRGLAQALRAAAIVATAKAAATRPRAAGAGNATAGIQIVAGCGEWIPTGGGEVFVPKAYELTTAGRYARARARLRVQPRTAQQLRWAFAAERRGELPLGTAQRWSQRATMGYESIEHGSAKTLRESLGLNIALK